MRLDEILKEWSIDNKINAETAHSDILNIPMLHGKYLGILSQHRISVHKAKFDYVKMKKIRKEYYLGNLDNTTLKEYGWPQFDLKIGTKSSIDIWLDADEYLIKLLEKRAYHEECASISESIMKELHSRTFQLKEFLTHTRFNAGSY